MIDWKFTPRFLAFSSVSLVALCASFTAQAQESGGASSDDSALGQLSSMFDSILGDEPASQEQVTSEAGDEIELQDEIDVGSNVKVPALPPIPPAPILKPPSIEDDVDAGPDSSGVPSVGAEPPLPAEVSAIISEAESLAASTLSKKTADETNAPPMPLLEEEADKELIPEDSSVMTPDMLRRLTEEYSEEESESALPESDDALAGNGVLQENAQQELDEKVLSFINNTLSLDEDESVEDVADIHDAVSPELPAPPPAPVVVEAAPVVALEPLPEMAPAAEKHEDTVAKEKILPATDEPSVGVVEKTEDILKDIFSEGETSDNASREVVTVEDPDVDRPEVTVLPDVSEPYPAIPESPEIILLEQIREDSSVASQIKTETEPQTDTANAPMVLRPQVEVDSISAEELPVEEEMDETVTEISPEAVVNNVEDMATPEQSGSIAIPTPLQPPSVMPATSEAKSEAPLPVDKPAQQASEEPNAAPVGAIPVPRPAAPMRKKEAPREVALSPAPIPVMKPAQKAILPWTEIKDETIVVFDEDDAVELPVDVLPADTLLDVSALDETKKVEPSPQEEADFMSRLSSLIESWWPASLSGASPAEPKEMESDSGTELQTSSTADVEEPADERKSSDGAPVIPQALEITISDPSEDIEVYIREHLSPENYNKNVTSRAIKRMKPAEDLSVDSRKVTPDAEVMRLFSSFDDIKRPAEPVESDDDLTVEADKGNAVPLPKVKPELKVDVKQADPVAPVSGEPVIDPTVAQAVVNHKAERAALEKPADSVTMEDAPRTQRLPDSLANGNVSGETTQVPAVVIVSSSSSDEVTAPDVKAVPEDPVQPEAAEYEGGFSKKTREILNKIPNGINSQQRESRDVVIDRAEKPAAIPAPDNFPGGSEIAISSSSESQETQINNWLETAYEALLVGQTESAIALYKRVLSIDPKQSLALFGLATTYHKGHQYAQAREYYDRILTEYPDHQEALNNFLVLMSQESPEEALRALTKLEQRNPDFSPVPAQIAMIYSKMGKLPIAAQYLTRALSLAPNNLTYRYNLAVLFDRIGDEQKAIKLYQYLADAAYSGQQIPGDLNNIQNRLTYLRKKLR